MTSSEYKVGTISEILASQSESSARTKNPKRKKTEKLQALFGNSSGNNETSAPLVYRTVTVGGEHVFEKKIDASAPAVSLKEKRKKKKAFGKKQLVNGDAVGEPVVREKIQKKVETVTGEPAKEKVKKKKVETVTGEPAKEKVKKKKVENVTGEPAKEKAKKRKVENVTGEPEKQKVKKKKVENVAVDGEPKKKVKVRRRKIGNEEQESREDDQHEENETIKEKKRKKKKPKIVLQDESISTTTEPSLEDKPKREKSDKNGERTKAKTKKSKSKQLKTEIKEEPEPDSSVEPKEEPEKQQDQKEEEEETPQEAKTLAQKNAPKPKDADLELRTVFVGNLPVGTEKKHVKKIFKKFGNLESVRIRGVSTIKPTTLKKVAIYRKEHNPDKTTLSAYVRYGSREEAIRAVESARGHLLNEHHLVVDLAVPNKRKGVDNKKSIFVGNIDRKTTDEELWRFFEDCGKVVSVRVVRDSTTGLGKGFGFINFDSQAAVEEAFRKNNHELRNREIRIKRCVKKLKMKKLLTDTKKVPKFSAKLNMEKVHKKFDASSRKGKVPVGNSTKFFKEKKGFTGDKLAEIGKLKRKSNKPNRGEMRKVKFAKMLTKTNNESDQVQGKKFKRFYD